VKGREVAKDTEACLKEVAEEALSNRASTPMFSPEDDEDDVEEEYD
jgi:hypothetical protein